MDYKEKYEQALERARQFSEKPYLEDSAGIVEYIFPELAESEDEKIRKAIIDVLKAVYECADIAFISQKQTLDSYVAYLEKEVEQKSVEWSEDDEQTFIKSVEALEDYGKFELADWLKEHKNKFLKLQSHWRPSDEQIETLEKVIGYSAFPDAKYCVELKRLLEQLKAL